MAIGSKLVKSLEDCMTAIGAQHALLATEETNTAAMNLFTAKCNYTISSSLVIYMRPISVPPKEQPADIRTDKLLVNQVISFYVREETEMQGRLSCRHLNDLEREAEPRHMGFVFQ